jgi:hypothetical protein
MPEWYDVLEPREAVIAGLVGLAVVWPLSYYAYHRLLLSVGPCPSAMERSWNGALPAQLCRSLLVGEMAIGLTADHRAVPT